MYWDGEHWVDEAPRRPAKRSASSATVAPRYSTLRSVGLIGTTLVMFFGFIVPWSPLAAASAGRFFGVPRAATRAGHTPSRARATSPSAPVPRRSPRPGRRPSLARSPRPRVAAATDRVPPNDRAAADDRQPADARPHADAAAHPGRPADADEREPTPKPPGSDAEAHAQADAEATPKPTPGRPPTARSTSRPPARTRTTGRSRRPGSRSTPRSRSSARATPCTSARAPTLSAARTSSTATARPQPDHHPRLSRRDADVQGHHDPGIFMWFRNAGYIKVSGLTIYGTRAGRPTSATAARSSSTPATPTDRHHEQRHLRCQRLGRDHAHLLRGAGSVRDLTIPATSWTAAGRTGPATTPTTTRAGPTSSSRTTRSGTSTSA